jgi:hypothetical protein
LPFDRKEKGVYATRGRGSATHSGGFVLAEEDENLRALAASMRPLPLRGVLEALGHVYDIVMDGYWTAKGPARICRIDKTEKITFDLELWPKPRQPRNAIDLVEGLLDMDYKGAIATLSSVCGTDGAKALAAQAAQDAAAKNFDDLPHKNLEIWKMRWGIRDYLIMHRGIPPQVVDAAHRLGAVWADDDRHAVFGLGRQYNKGVEVRGTYGWQKGFLNNFHQTRGAKEPFFLPSIATNSQKIVVIVESAIEAMSFQAQHLNAFVLSTGGTNYKIPLIHLESINKQGYQIVTAFNRDGAGDKHRKAFQSMADADMKPTKNDWNDDLRAGIKTEMPATKIESSAATLESDTFNR